MEHDGEESHMHFVPINMEEIRAKQQMANHAAIHGVMDFIHGLTEGQLESLGFLMHSVADPNQSALLASHFEGVIKQVLHFKHGWCACGERHALAEDLLPPVDVYKTSDEDRVNIADHWSDNPGETYSDPAPLRTMEERTDEALDRAATEVATSEDDLMSAADEKRARLMDEYNMITVDGKVTCKLCGSPFTTLRDRMLREPSDCSGCRIKNSQG